MPYFEDLFDHLADPKFKERMVPSDGSWQTMPHFEDPFDHMADPRFKDRMVSSAGSSKTKGSPPRSPQPRRQGEMMSDKLTEDLELNEFLQLEQKIVAKGEAKLLELEQKMAAEGKAKLRTASHTLKSSEGSDLWTKETLELDEYLALEREVLAKVERRVRSFTA